MNARGDTLLKVMTDEVLTSAVKIVSSEIHQQHMQFKEFEGCNDHYAHNNLCPGYWPFYMNHS
jgi:hypothetical protein